MKIIPKRAIVSWCFYDWASSSFYSVIMTFIFATYFTTEVAINKIFGTAQWGDAVAISGIFIAVLSPIFGAIADHEGRRKPWLGLFTVITIIATTLLWWIKPNPSFAYRALVLMIVATVAIEIATVFYNAMMRTLVPKARLGRISGWAWGFGYAGGLICLLMVLYGFVYGDITWLPLNREELEQIRICGPFVAVWFALFAWPLFVFTPDQKSKGVSIGYSIKHGVSDLIDMLKKIHHYKNIAVFLIARMIYIDGLNTLFAFGGIYAAGTFGMNFSEVIAFGVGMNIAAGIGAASFAWLDDYMGAKKTVLIALLGLLVAGSAAIFTHNKTHFWVYGMALSLFVGPAQAASRSLMARLAPRELMAKMFGLYALSGKATAFLGPWILGMITLHFNSQRIGMTTVLCFLFVGALLLSVVKEPR